MPSSILYDRNYLALDGWTLKVARGAKTTAAAVCGYSQPHCPLQAFVEI